MSELGWIVAAVLALVVIWEWRVIEHAYRSGISQGRIQEMHEQIDREYTAPVAFTRSQTRAGGEAVRVVRE